MSLRRKSLESNFSWLLGLKEDTMRTVVRRVGSCCIGGAVLCLGGVLATPRGLFTEFLMGGMFILAVVGGVLLFNAIRH